MIWTIFKANKDDFNHIFTVIHPANHLWPTKVFYCIHFDEQVTIYEFFATQGGGGDDPPVRHATPRSQYGRQPKNFSRRDSGPITSWVAPLNLSEKN